MFQWIESDMQDKDASVNRRSRYWSHSRVREKRRDSLTLSFSESSPSAVEVTQLQHAAHFTKFIRQLKDIASYTSSSWILILFVHGLPRGRGGCLRSVVLSRHRRAAGCGWDQVGHPETGAGCRGQGCPPQLEKLADQRSIAAATTQPPSTPALLVSHPAPWQADTLKQVEVEGWVWIEMLWESVVLCVTRLHRHLLTPAASLPGGAQLWTPSCFNSITIPPPSFHHMLSNQPFPSCNTHFCQFCRQCASVRREPLPCSFLIPSNFDQHSIVVISFILISISITLCQWTDASEQSW